MRRLVVIVLTVVLAMAFSLPSQAAQTPKQDVCHKGKTVSVSGNSVDSHLAHGDTAGACA